MVTHLIRLWYDPGINGLRGNPTGWYGDAMSLAVPPSTNNYVHGGAGVATKEEAQAQVVAAMKRVGWSGTASVVEVPMVLADAKKTPVRKSRAYGKR